MPSGCQRDMLRSRQPGTQITVSAMRHNTRLKKQVCCLHNLFSELSLGQARHLLAFLSTKRLINAVLVVHSSHAIPLIFSSQSRISPISIAKADGYCHVWHSHSFCQKSVVIGSDQIRALARRKPRGCIPW